jgi:hypothetical protein
MSTWDKAQKSKGVQKKMTSTTMQIYIADEMQKQEFKAFAARHGMSVSELISRAVLSYMKQIPARKVSAIEGI